MTACNAQCFDPSTAHCTGYGLDCPMPQQGGYGKISARSKGQSKNAAKAQNEYEDATSNLKYTESGNEVQNAQASETGYLVSKQFIAINGCYDVE